MDLMVFLATLARICIVWVSGTSLRYVTGMSRAKKSCEPWYSLLLVMMTSFCAGSPYKSEISKSTGPGFDRPHCRQPNRSPYGRDYRGCVFEIKRNFWHFARPPARGGRNRNRALSTTYSRQDRRRTQGGVDEPRDPTRPGG